jgi:hypothetical protein
MPFLWYNSARFPSETSALLGWQKEARFPHWKTAFDCQSQPKGFMRLDQEAQKAEERILEGAIEIDDVATLKRILNECLTAFEKETNALPKPERDEALSLYLDKLRKVTFSFHYTILRRAADKQFYSSPSNEAIEPIVAQHRENFYDLGRLYRFL